MEQGKKNHSREDSELKWFEIFIHFILKTWQKKKMSNKLTVVILRGQLSGINFTQCILIIFTFMLLPQLLSDLPPSSCSPQGLALFEK